MRTCFWLTAFTILLPCCAGAQTTREGVRALLRGDYASAARILRPLAEDNPDADPVAQFFMASLYQSGLGVGLNMSRACGLYFRAAAVPTNPLLMQSLVLAEAIRDVDPRQLSYRCNATAEEGWNDPRPVIFTLDANHSVTIDQTGLTIRYRGEAKRANMELGGPGWVNLPTRYLPVDLAAAVPTRRHFIQFSWWTPDRTSGATIWTLSSVLYEVRGLEIDWVAGEAMLSTAVGPKPPASTDIDGLASVRSNESGETEWIVSGGKPRITIIPATGSR